MFIFFLLRLLIFFCIIFVDNMIDNYEGWKFLVQAKKICAPFRRFEITRQVTHNNQTTQNMLCLLIQCIVGGLRYKFLFTDISGIQFEHNSNKSYTYSESNSIKYLQNEICIRNTGIVNIIIVILLALALGFVKVSECRFYTLKK